MLQVRSASEVHRAVAHVVMWCAPTVLSIETGTTFIPGGFVQQQTLPGPGASTSPDVLPPHPVLAGFYSDAAERQAVVNRLFDDAAPYYDRVTGLFSAWTGRRYRRAVLRRVGAGPGKRVLDVACGTGQVAREALRLVGRGGAVV